MIFDKHLHPMSWRVDAFWIKAGTGNRYFYYFHVADVSVCDSQKSGMYNHASGLTD